MDIMTIFNTAITTHIVFGVVAFIGSVLTATSFGDKFSTLSTKQKLAIGFSYVGVMGSTVLGFASRFNNPVWFIGTAVAIVIFTFTAIARASKKATATKTVNKSL